jgi:hypothetical protein
LAPPKTKWLAAKEEERAKYEASRPDQHVLPEDKFKKGKLKVNLPFKQIDLIFNHKNLWANLQNPDPAVIWYNLHD